MAVRMAYEPLYVAYLIYFNRDRDYFECHEVLEELWLARERDPLYKGLLQAAVGLYHYRSGNVRGARMMLASSAGRLEKYPAVTLGIDLGKLRAECAAYAQRLEAVERGAEAPFAYYDLDIEIVDGALAKEVSLRSRTLAPNVPQQRGPRRRKNPAGKQD
ncbi:DUF309 domain-containing protein [Paenibacillus glufosinatiresistens]|uniref:DUF309 domain-containing protein n=1 Tax=Paenibacillus glufosinatiresistens TaxID=3070657 RepID=UPI00286EAD2B|nr:DUF309 domain-containing protein [Paenibacillus sp. YX.27]